MVMIVAEVGVNHDGDVVKAHKMIDVAAACGADAVKFQTYKAATLEPKGERRDMLARLQLNKESFFALKAHCVAKRIEFMSTPFDPESLHFLVEQVGLRHLKIGSGNLDNVPLLEAAGKTPLPILLSTGMADGEKVGKGLSLIGKGGPVCLLHCVSAYPCPNDQVNLLAIQALRNQFNLPVGLSDHTVSVTVVPILAVGLGVQVLEKHLTLDRSSPGPDHHMSTLPKEFRLMVESVQIAKQVLGSGMKRVLPVEREVIEIAKMRRRYRRK